MTYFHELPKEEKERILASRMLMCEFMDKYQQPAWCKFPNALSGLMGCWSLMLGDIETIRDCRECDDSTGRGRDVFKL